MEEAEYMDGETEYGDEDLENMIDEEPLVPTAVNLRGQLPPPAWVLECKHWLPAKSPAAARAVIPADSEEVCVPSILISTALLDVELRAIH